MESALLDIAAPPSPGSHCTTLVRTIRDADPAIAFHPIKTGETVSAVILDVAGEIDLQSAPQLWRHIRLAASRFLWPEPAAESPLPAVLINLGDVEYIDSAGIALFFATTRFLRSRHGLPPMDARQRPEVFSLCGSSALVRRALHISRVDRFIPVFDGEAEALRAIRAARFGLSA